jgi:LPXTG-motif cell wall-anchored protein
MTASVPKSGSSAGDITGIAGGNSAALFGSTKGGEEVSFTSSVLSGLGSLKGGDYSLAFSSLQPAFLTASDGVLQSFKAAGSGTFGAPVPEASTMISFGVLLLGGAVLIFARRRRAADSAA